MFFTGNEEEKMYKVTKTAEISNFIFKFENELKYDIT